MKTYVGFAAAAALLALIQGCSGDDDRRSDPPSTCTPALHTDPDPTGAEQFCVDYMTAFCDRAFGDCGALGAPYATRDECVSEESAVCALLDLSNFWYDGPCGSVCIGFIRAVSCDVLVAVEDIQACDAALGYASNPVPDPAPEPVATITPGTLTDGIVAGDPMYDGGHARAYAIHLTAGQYVVIQTASGGASPIGDTVLHLLDPSGVQLAENDDYSYGYYSRIALTVPTTGYHRILVRGYSSGYVGTYQLTVTASP